MGASLPPLVAAPGNEQPCDAHGEPVENDRGVAIGGPDHRTGEERELGAAGLGERCQRVVRVARQPSPSDGPA